MATIYVDSNAAGANDGTSWTDAYTAIDNAGVTGAAAGSEIRVAHNHSQVAAATITLSFSNATMASPISIISTNSGTDVYQAGADIGATGSFDVTITGTGVYIYGLTVSDSDQLSITPSADGFLYAEGCSFTSDDEMYLSGGTDGRGEFVNCTITANESSNLGALRIQVQDHETVFRNCTFNHPNQGILFNLPDNVKVTAEDCDMTAHLTKIATLGSTGGRTQCIVRRCNLKSGWTSLDNTLSASNSWILVESCASGNPSDPVLGLTEYTDVYGTITSDLTAYRTGGADDGEQANAHSWKMVSTANTTELSGALRTPPMAVWANPDASISAATAQGLFQSSRATPLATPAALTTDSSSTWTGSGLDTFQKIATTIGDYTATVYVATDGVTLNDDDFWVEVSAPDQVGGPVVVRCFLAKPSTTVYVDPKVEIT